MIARCRDPQILTFLSLNNSWKIGLDLKYQQQLNAARVLPPVMFTPCVSKRANSENPCVIIT